ncbi:hypothetical protein [Yeosuana marina]|uniref:hypothetical protein n=1 Tax=Yeosuana marina TaxID=1565536 RepID=UPI0030C83DD0
MFSNALILLLKRRGHNVEVRTNEYLTSDNGTKAIINGEAFEICVRENRKRVQVKSEYSNWMNTKYVPTGVLTLRIEELYNHQWADSKTKKLEDKLPNILAYLELRAKKEIEERKRSEKWHKEYQEKLKKEKELKDRIDNELATFKAVINNSSRWQKSMDLRNYIKVVEKDAIENNKLNEELKAWLKWIKDKADWYDPLIEKEDELFEGIDRDSI